MFVIFCFIFVHNAKMKIQDFFVTFVLAEGMCVRDVISFFSQNLWVICVVRF